MAFDDPFTSDALRRHRAYQEGVVERYGVCPWAKSARQNERVRAHVVSGEAPDARSLQRIVDDWAGDETCDVGFIIVPEFDRGIDAFDEWTTRVGELQAEVFLAAPFHPNAPPNAGVVRFLRQTPDPTVQLVRRSRLEEVRAQDPPHYQDIFSLDLGTLDSPTPVRTVAASVLAHNSRLVATHREALESLLGAKAPSKPPVR